METMTKPPDNIVREIIQPLLSPREELIWVGQPWQGVRLYPSDWFFIPLSLFSSIFIGIFGTIFLQGPFSTFTLIGIGAWAGVVYVILGRFLLDAYWRSRTYYGLTNRRIIIHTTAFRNKTQFFDVRSLSDFCMDIGRTTQGTIVLGNTYGIWNVPIPRGMPLMGYSPPPPALDHIPDAPMVYDLIEDIRG